MAHQSWYRKYRPQTFDDVVGQAHIERTLRNAVEEGAVAHAYLFTGPRGTGKTTTARLLAKALNCQAGPTGEPDDTCEDCRQIAEGSHPDVYELDAASRTGVDAVREEIIGRVSYAPTRGRYKVYIIDEAHMLSAAAFNALLKTLEEPPPNTVFVLCTTHPQKVPETIHSRCQRFEFRRLSVEEIAERLKHIAGAEGVEVEDAALSLIARHAAGGMRDAITTLEQLASFASGPVTLEDAEGLLGEVGSEELFEVVDLLAAGDLGELFGFVAGLSERGADLAEFALALARHARDLLVALVLDDPGLALDVPADDLRRLRRQARELGQARVVRMLDVLDELMSAMRNAADVRLALEVALTRLARPESDLTLEALAERIEAVEDALRSGAPAPAPVPARKARPEASSAKAKPEKPAASPRPEPLSRTTQHATPEAAAGAGALDPRTVKRSWPAIIAEVRKKKPARSHLFDSTEPEVVGDAIVVEFPRDRAFSMDMAREPETLALLKAAIERVLGTVAPIEFRLGREGASSPAERVDEPVARAEAAAASADEPVARAEEPGQSALSEDRGAVEGVEKAPVPAADPATTTERAPSAASGAVGADDIEARLMAELGATVVEERTIGDADDGSQS
ncbi:DNA polymerase III subunit gamma/tau [Coriobacteriia bacterium Es71-Z0120]|uniref:DNA polymerase III subunit gamma/tau n=1 Tax=Parvivirga hydrogeniphila TaxID=2939460 RepID=UPI002260B53D|nr:DNA polymerase III subunit gamma/tau [Parvivirga hydrogeniphila]MCL4078324.1 DNA polymerase III subunit gamma/tau [Parvivirga hydrogeniphila]